MNEEILKQLTARLEAVLEWSKAHPGSTLRELEEQVQGAVDKVRAELMAAAVAQQGVGMLQEERCSCGGRWVFQGYRKRWVMTQHGTIQVQRAYYTCDRCGAGFFPPGPTVGDHEGGME